MPYDFDEDLYHNERMQYRTPDVVGFALEILHMQETIEHQRKEIEHLKFFKEKYHEVVNSSIKHGEIMMGNMLEALLTPGVHECLKDAGTFEEGEEDVTHNNS